LYEKIITHPALVIAAKRTASGPLPLENKGEGFFIYVLFPLKILK
jgi:hypothetical protein